MATYQQLFNLCKKKFNISWLYGQSHANEKLFLTEKAKQYPTLCVGFLNIIHPDRLHIIGPAEIEFFNQISHDARVGFLQKLVENNSLGLFVCLDLALPDDMIQPLIDTNLPVFGTSEPPEKVLTFVRHNIVKLLAPSCSMHGVFMDVFGMGILLSGQSGIGKSEAAAELLKRGHRLIADDAVEIRKVAGNTLRGTSPELIRNYIEIRGIGVINVAKLFGMAAIKDESTVDLVVNIVPVGNEQIFDRLGLEEQYMDLLGVKVPAITIPVRPGRNLAIILEVAAMNNRQKKMGYNAAAEFTEQINRHFDETAGQSF